MVTKKRSTIIEELPPEGTPMYGVLNRSNDFDPANKLAFNTEAEAEAKAHEILTANPSHQVITVKLLKTFKATVTIEGTPVDTSA